MKQANFVFQHPIGPIYGFISDVGVKELLLPQGSLPHLSLCEQQTNSSLGSRLFRSLEGYFSGENESFEDIPLDLSGATAFRRDVWMGARSIPWGQKTTYAELAEYIGRTKGAARAVGQALGANPIPIIIPCHRILASGGALGGFSAGLDWKKTLLQVEYGAKYF
jgi:methylated-DNA-[protein]-cysteine S-methyltransferase